MKKKIPVYKSKEKETMFVRVEMVEEDPAERFRSFPKGEPVAWLALEKEREEEAKKNKPLKA